MMIALSSALRCSLLGLLCFTATTVVRGQDGPTPEAFVWQPGTPESHGLSSDRLDALRDSLAPTTKALLVVRNDRIVYEWYAADHSAKKTHYTASLAKAIVAGLSTGIALDDELLALDDPAAKFVPSWKLDPQKRQITLRQLGSHTSGLDDAEQDDIPHNKLTGWQGDFWKRLSPPNDPFTIARDKTPVIFPPGTKSQYSNPGIAMLTYATTAALKESPQRDIRALLRERIMRPIGVPDREWSVGYGQTVEVDGLPLVGSWGGGGYTARALASVGRLMLREGDWQGKRLLSAEVVREITSDAGTPGNGGIGWWSNNEGLHPKLPRDAFWGAGAGHQILLVVPSLNLIVVRNGGALDPKKPYQTALGERLFNPLMETLADEQASAAPYPRSELITAVHWAPKETIVRRARGGDNWPLTWADDDQLYTAYGDGRGFEPFVPKKLSLGFCRIEGGPDDFTGINLRAPTGEQIGDGPQGKKASGLLMVDGVLYLLARNAGNAQLAWSKDHGASWTWADWKFEESYGCPTFLNFGRNYAGARDEFVYIYSHDRDSAYEPADRMVLARAPKNRLTDRAAYTFFQRLDADGAPVWTTDVRERGGVFEHPGKCYRAGISYNAALKRYLWYQVIPGRGAGKDTRFTGGMGVYEAPEPWGPWRTAFFTTAWDVGPGESGSFPTKWMNRDRKTACLVFSGDDAFSVRRATFELGAP